MEVVVDFTKKYDDYFEHELMEIRRANYKDYAYILLSKLVDDGEAEMGIDPDGYETFWLTPAGVAKLDELEKKRDA